MLGNEEDRIREVHKYLSLDLSQSPELQDIVDLAAQLCDKPIALLTFLDEQVNWLKVRSGVAVEVMPRNTSFCQYAVQQDQVLIVPDASRDERFDDNPLVHSDPNIRFYAGAPLVLNNGLKLGTLCLFDLKANAITAVQQKALRTLARQAAALLELEQSKAELNKQVEEIQAKNETLVKIAYMQSHDIRHPLTSVMGLMELVKENLQAVDAQWLEMMSEATNVLDSRIKAIVAESVSEKDLKAMRFNKMIEEIEDYAILLLDQDGYIENWNKGARLLKGYNADEIIGKNFKVFYTAKDRKAQRPAKLIALATRNGVAKDEGWRVRKDGTEFWGSIVITAIHNEKKEVIGFTKMTRKIMAIPEAANVAEVCLP